jgi:hypothetical protein
VSNDRVEARRWSAQPLTRYVAEISDSTYQLYWGDFHRHSLVSRCLSGEEPTVDDYDRYSRDVCEYDFWALTDHAEHTSAYQWWATKKRADLLRMDGHFVPLYGFEWTSLYGHHNVIYDDVDRGAPIFSAVAPETLRPDQLWAALRASGYRSVTIPHHPGSRRMAVDWSYYDPELLRLAEVFQACRGNYEAKDAFRRWGDASADGAFIVDALERGIRIGLIASSDHGYGAAYVGAYAHSLDRASIFEAIHARRTIAATTRGIVLDVRASGAFLGEELIHTGGVDIEVNATAYEEIARLDLIRNGSLIESIVSKPALARGQIAVPVHLEWDETEGMMDWSGTLSVIGGSVLETEYWSPAITDVSPTAVSWAAKTLRGHRGGVDLTLLGSSDAEVHVTAGAHRLASKLGRLASGTWPSVRLPSGGRLSLSPGFGGLTGVGDTHAAIASIDDPAGAAWYMARVTLIDGEMAWSSPIWIDRYEPGDPRRRPRRSGLAP